MTCLREGDGMARRRETDVRTSDPLLHKLWILGLVVVSRLKTSSSSVLCNECFAVLLKRF
jgi:hypothetical protein